MTSSTKEYIPYESVSPIVLMNKNFPEYPFFGGTGFFVFFPPFDEIFFITARHCVFDSTNSAIGKPYVHYCNDGTNKKGIPFSCQLETKYNENDEEFEDLIIYVVDDDKISQKDKNELLKVSLELLHQDDIDNILNSVIFSNGNLRTVGYPAVSKSMDYEKKLAVTETRGFYAKVTHENEFKHRYKLKNGNWSDGELNGFSGSPMIELLHTTQGNVKAVPVGVLLTESHFISINIATNTIANYINQSHDVQFSTVS